MNNNIPDWLQKNEVYSPPKDNDNFIKESTLSILGVLSKIQINSKNEKYPEASSLILLSNLFLIIMISSSKNIYFTLIISTLILLRIAMMSGTDIIKVFKSSTSAIIFSSFILLPSIVLFHNYANSISILIKVFCSVSIMAIFSITTKWNTLTSSLAKFRIPNLIILTFDITLKYIVLLGNLCIEMLTALRIRSVGRNSKKQRTLSGILGVTFIKSKEMSEEMYQAMECRCFTGKYYLSDKKIPRKIVFIYISLIIAILILFLYMEGLIL